MARNCGDIEWILKQDLDQDLSLCNIDREPLKLHFRGILISTGFKCYTQVLFGEQVLVSIEVASC